MPYAYSGLAISETSKTKVTPPDWQVTPVIFMKL